MQQVLSSNLALYILTIVLAVLFLLQIWAIFRIKEMLRQVMEIFRFVRAGTLATKHQIREPEKTPKRICENCRFRSTYISSDPRFEIVYHCNKHDKQIELKEFCQFYELDEQHEEN